MSKTVEGHAAHEWRQHWTVVSGAFAGMAVASVISYAGSLFIEPMEQEFGWSRAQIMSGHSIAATIAAISAPFTGLFVDRFGSRRIGLAAILILSIAICMLSLTSADIWHWRALWLPMTLGIVLVQPVVWTGAITSLFSAGRGLALAVTLCGSSVASIIVPGMTYSLIQGWGWRMAWVGLGGLWLIFAMPIVWLFFTSAKDKERTLRQTAASELVAERPSVWQSGILTRRFFQLLIAGVCIALVVVTLVVSIVPVLSASNIERGDAASLAALIGVTAIFGRLTIGWLLDRMDGRIIAATCVSLPILGLLILINVPGSLVAAACAVLIFGFSLGAELDIVAYLTSRYFGRENFGVLFGTIGGAIGLAAGNGPIVLNAVYDVTGSYHPALWVAMPICLVSAALFLLLGAYPDLKSEGETAARVDR